MSWRTLQELIDSQYSTRPEEEDPGIYAGEPDPGLFYAGQEQPGLFDDYTRSQMDFGFFEEPTPLFKRLTARDVLQSAQESRRAALQGSTGITKRPALRSKRVLFQAGTTVEKFPKRNKQDPQYHNWANALTPRDVMNFATVGPGTSRFDKKYHGWFTRMTPQVTARATDVYEPPLPELEEFEEEKAPEQEVIVGKIGTGLRIDPRRNPEEEVRVSEQELAVNKPNRTLPRSSQLRSVRRQQQPVILVSPTALQRAPPPEPSALQQVRAQVQLTEQNKRKAAANKAVAAAKLKLAKANRQVELARRAAEEARKNQMQSNMYLASLAGQQREAYETLIAAEETEPINLSILQEQAQHQEQYPEIIQRAIRQEDLYKVIIDANRTYQLLDQNELAAEGISLEDFVRARLTVEGYM